MTKRVPVLARLAPSPVANHVMRTVAAALLALWLAYALQLSSPSSASMTVLIVAHPMRGAILAKSLHRVLGTLIGGVMSLVLMEAFAQQPEFFLAGFALWLGVCTALASLLRHFRAYGAVLAGYTVALVGFSAVGDPDNLFLIVVSRLSVVILGVVCSAVVSGVLSGNGAVRQMRVRFAALAGDAATYAAAVLRGGSVDHAPMLALMARVRELDGLVEYAGAESVDVDAAAPRLRRGLAGLYTLLSLLPEMGRLLDRLEHHSRGTLPADLRSRLSAAVCDRLTCADLEAVDADGLLPASADLVGQGRRRGLAIALVRGMVRDRLTEVLAAAAGVGAAAATAGGGQGRTVLDGHALSYYRDYYGAAINGVRAALACALGGALWLATGMSTGATLMIMIGPIMGLLSAFDHPDQAALGFLKGVAVASVMGAIFLFGVAPQMSGFPALALSLAPFLAIGVYCATKPQWAGMATAYLIFFMALTAPTNPMVYDPQGYANSAFAMVMGAVIAMLCFRVLLPVNSRARAGRLAGQIIADVTYLATQLRLENRAAWSYRQHERLFRLIGWLPPDHPQRIPVLTAGTRVLAIGCALYRLRQAMAEGELQSQLAPVLAMIARREADPQEAARVARRAGHELLADAEGDRGRVAAALSLIELAHLLNRFGRLRDLLP